MPTAGASLIVARHSCDEAMVSASNKALRDMSPALWRLHLENPDRHMARRIRDLCDELVASDTAKPAAVVVIVGARHVPGIHSLLATDAGMTDEHQECGSHR